jgi:hypothetical protein
MRQQPGSPRRHLPSSCPPQNSSPLGQRRRWSSSCDQGYTLLGSHPQCCFLFHSRTNKVVAPDAQTWAFNTISSSSFRSRSPQISGEQNLLLPLLSRPHTQI